MRSWGDLDSSSASKAPAATGRLRHLAAAGVPIRPNRQSQVRSPARRRPHGRCCPARRSARSADGRRSNTAPTRRSLRRQGPHHAINQLKGHLVTVAEQVAAPLRGLATGALVNACARLRPNPDSGEVAAAAKRALRVLARRYGALSGEISARPSRPLCAQANPALLAARGVGPDVAASAHRRGRQPRAPQTRLPSPPSAAPPPSKRLHTVRHRLNRGGDRHANNALWRIAMVRLRHDERTKAYAARRTAQGKSRREIIRRQPHRTEIHQLLTDPPRPLSTPPPAAGATIAAAGAINACPNRLSESNEAPTTTVTSPLATTTGSPKTPLDKHRSIVCCASSR